MEQRQKKEIVGIFQLESVEELMDEQEKQSLVKDEIDSELVVLNPDMEESFSKPRRRQALTKVGKAKKPRYHLRQEVCCCRTCVGAYERLYFAEGSCPEGLVRKQIVDRLGRKSRRCVRQDEGEGGQANIEAFESVMATTSATNRQEFAENFLGAEAVAEGGGFTREGWSDFVDGEKESMGAFKKTATFRTAEAFGRWLGSSVGGSANGIHQAMVHIFGDKEGRYEKGLNAVNDVLVTNGKVKQLLPRTGPLDDEVVKLAKDIKASMEIEQAYWKDKLGEGGKLTLFRGMKVPPGSVDRGNTVVQDFPASSWTMGKRVAISFGSTMLKREVAPEEIIASIFSQLDEAGEGEFIVYTPEEGAEAEVMFTPPAES